MFSELNLNSLRIDHNFNGSPYHISFVCNIDKTSCLFHVRKEEKWGIHYIAHASECCEHCDSVRLYTTCEVFTELIKGNEVTLFNWVRQQLPIERD